MEHHYTSRISWTGNLGTGTSGYKGLCEDMGHRYNRQRHYPLLQ